MTMAGNDMGYKQGPKISDANREAKTSSNGSTNNRAENGSELTETEEAKLKRIPAIRKQASVATVAILSHPGASVVQTINAACKDFSRSQKTAKVKESSASCAWPSVNMHMYGSISCIWCALGCPGPQGTVEATLPSSHSHCPLATFHWPAIQTVFRGQFSDMLPILTLAFTATWSSFCWRAVFGMARRPRLPQASRAWLGVEKPA
mmetsp:Transcript_85055/g.244099  ORF Transcript_85055/g.244099 Transcript_85055/m.244099 type:complete len:206 (-) Transcript_85055:1208-1825(-)